MLGHVFGLLVYYSFGKTSSGRFADLKSLAKALGVILIFGLFYGFSYFQDYVLQNYTSIKESSAVTSLSTRSPYFPWTGRRFRHRSLESTSLSWGCLLCPYLPPLGEDKRGFLHKWKKEESGRTRGVSA